MKDSKAQGNNSNQSVNVLLRCAAGVVLIFVGYEIAPFIYPDQDDDGLPNAVEIKCFTDPYNADSDKDGIKDGKETFRLYYGTPTTLSDTLLADEVCLTGLEGEKDVCYHPAEILEFEITKDGRCILYDWRGEAYYVKENLNEIDALMRSIGYNHFLRVKRQNLANMLLAECLNGDTLYLSKEENLWCHVPREKLQMVLEQIGNCH